MSVPSTPTPVSELSYERARDELVTVVARLEAGGETLEASLALWERGEALATRCLEWLDGARARLEAADPTAAARPGAGRATQPDGKGTLDEKGTLDGKGTLDDEESADDEHALDDDTRDDTRDDARDDTRDDEDADEDEAVDEAVDDSDDSDDSDDGEGGR